MAQIDEFFFDTNRVEGITEADYERAQPYIEAAQAFAQSTYQGIYIIDYFRKNFLYVSDNPLFLCGHTADAADVQHDARHDEQQPRQQQRIAADQRWYPCCSQRQCS